MPLVTITCSKGIYPPDEDSPSIMPNLGQEAVVSLAKALPNMMVENAIELGLDPEHTPQDGVQVDIKKFHAHAVNAVELWIQVQLTELYPGRDKALQIRDRFVNLLFLDVESRRGLELRRAVDLFWGPGHGYLHLNSASNITW